MVVQRTPPPVRRSPRKEASTVTRSPSSSQPPLSSQAQKVAQTIASTPSTGSRAPPFTPLQQHSAAADFPSLDQMAAVSKEEHRSLTRPTTNRAAFAASFPASTSNTVPSSLPRATAQLRSSQLDEADSHDQRARAARSSLTNGAIQRVRQQAGDETPLGVSQARAARKAFAPNPASSQPSNSLMADDSGDSTAQLVPGPLDINPLLATIDVENPQMPSLTQTSAPPPSTSAASNAVPTTTQAAADVSTASQASIFGTAGRRNGVDQPIGGPKAGTAYDFSKYLDGELDPFNRASRVNVSRQSRPLPAAQQQAADANDQDADSSGDTTARGVFATATTTTAAPIESTPFLDRVKAASANTPRMSPHASPSVSSRNLRHLSSLTNGHSTPCAANQAPLADASTISLASHNRFDPSARADRLQSMELGELRKKATALSRDLTAAHDALSSAKEESEGWASECSGLQEQLSTLKATHQAAVARETRARSELQVRLSQYKIEADDRAWKLLSQRRQTCLIEVALQHAKNEATFHEGRYHATESELEAQKDELRIRLMLERKRADLLSLHVKAALRDSARIKKRLGAKSALVLELQAENESLAEQLEDARLSRGTAGPSRDSEAAATLKRQLEEAQVEIETLNERDAMMAETRKTWKAERKQLLAQVQELSSGSAPLSVAKVTEAPRPLKTAKSLAATQMLPPSSPVYAKQKSRRPMQGASELGPLSDDESDRRTLPSTTAVARKAVPAKTSAPLVPFAQISTKTSSSAVNSKKTTKSTVASSKSKPSNNWRDEVAITDSEQDSDSDDGGRPNSRPKSKGVTGKRAIGKSSAGGKKTKPSMPIEYDDQTADPSATPIIRTKRPLPAPAPAAISDEDVGPLDSSILATKFGRDRTNVLGAKPAKASTLKANLALASKNADAAAGGKKKKRKLLGGGAGAMQWGTGDAAGLAPNFDIPLELSPIKGGGKVGGGGGAALLSGFGMGRNPFA